MPPWLTPQERAALRQLEEDTEREDPGFAQLFGSGRPWLAEHSPANWPPLVYVLIGVAFLVLGIVLAVPSALLGGLGALGLAVWRSPSARRFLVRMVSGIVGDENA